MTELCQEPNRLTCGAGPPAGRVCRGPRSGVRT
jgi:hypothetical protein